ncbi:IS1167 transposase [Streptococcus pneumoniae]|nr:IS1167 transposase [Streptococcus pneumoniae]
MKSDQTIIRKIHMEQLHFITKLLDIKNPNIQIIDIINRDTHKEIIAKLDYDAPSCPYCGSQMKKYDFQNLLKFLTLKLLVCLLEFSLENVVSSAIIALK